MKILPRKKSIPNTSNMSWFWIYFAYLHTAVWEWVKTLLSQNVLFLLISSVFYIIKRIVFTGTFYRPELLYSDLEPWMSWSCWVFPPWPSNSGLTFDSLLVIIFCLEDSVLCFSVKSGGSNKQIFTKCLIWASGEGNGNPLQYSCLENPINGGTL